MKRTCFRGGHTRSLGELIQNNIAIDKFMSSNTSINLSNDKIRPMDIVVENVICKYLDFDDKIFNALIDRIKVLESMHFVSVLRNGMRGEEKV